MFGSDSYKSKFDIVLKYFVKTSSTNYIHRLFEYLIFQTTINFIFIVMYIYLSFDHIV